MPQASEPGGRGAAAQPGGKGGRAKEDGKGGASRPCPICGKPSQAATEPFCSKRCRDVDLNRWLSGSYVVPGAESDDEGSE
jgi:endogenous inhibitor of DNA gyrase (YacG/DUF329 family)